MARKTRRNRSMKRGIKNIKGYSKKAFGLVKKSAGIAKVGAEEFGSNVSIVAKKSAPVVEKGLEGIFGALKATTNYTLSKAKGLERSIAKKTRRRRRSSVGKRGRK